MGEFAFRVNIVAVVRVHAADENVARKIVPEVLGAPSAAEVRLINENHAALGRDATVTDVDFDVGSIKLANCGSDLGGTEAAAPVRAARVRHKQSPALLVAARDHHPSSTALARLFTVARNWTALDLGTHTKENEGDCPACFGARMRRPPRPCNRTRSAMSRHSLRRGLHPGNMPPAAWRRRGPYKQGD